MTPNRSEIEIHVNRRTTMKINPEPLPFKRKLFSEETASTSVAENEHQKFQKTIIEEYFNTIQETN